VKPWAKETLKVFTAPTSEISQSDAEPKCTRILPYQVNNLIWPDLWPNLGTVHEIPNSVLFGRVLGSLISLALTTTWLAQLVECQSAVREVGFEPQTGPTVRVLK